MPAKCFPRASRTPRCNRLALHRFLPRVRSPGDVTSSWRSNGSRLARARDPVDAVRARQGTVAQVMTELGLPYRGRYGRI